MSLTCEGTTNCITAIIRVTDLKYGSPEEGLGEKVKQPSVVKGCSAEVYFICMAWYMNV